MSKIKMGVIGVGYLGRFHAAKYARMKDVELVGVTDTNNNSAQDIANQLQTRVFKDVHELLGHVDAVSVVVPTRSHFEVADTCLKNGIDVMLEKPMTTTLVEAEGLIEQARRSNRILQIGHIEQFNPAIIAMEQYITTPLFIEAQRIHTFKNRGTDVDVVLDLMIHDIDIILSMVPSPLKSIHAVGMPVLSNSSDIANARLIFENGCTANLTASRIAQTNIRKLRVFQPQSYITVDYGSKEITILEKEEKTDGCPQGVPLKKPLHFAFPEKDALELELKAFVLNTQQRTEPKVDGVKGRTTLKTAQQIIEHIQSHLEEHQTLLS